MNSLTKRLITSLILGIATGFIAVWLINVTGRPGQFFLIGVCTAIAIVIGLAIPKRRDTHQQSTHSQPVSFFSSASDREDIFISYRRSDTRDATGRIHEALATHFGDHNIYYDVYDIPPGVDFRSDIETTIHQCRVLLVMIGQYWLNEQNKPRLHNSDDYVRFEVETALKNQIKNTSCGRNRIDGVELTKRSTLT